MGLFDNAVPGGNISKPLMIVLGALLAGKMMGGLGGSDPAPASRSGATPQPGTSGMGTGGWTGGLGTLLQRLRAAGHADVADSWVGTGPNAPIQPNQLNSALGQTTVSDLARHAGISEQELLAQLSQVLPGVVDKLTPGGRIPGQAEIATHFGH
jgi:uncharacterized protein YidB (DUF937 family)